MPNLPVIDNDAEYALARTDLTNVMDLSVELPDSPFKSVLDSPTKRGTFSFCEFEVALSGGFGVILSALASMYGDEHVSGAAVDPDAQAAYWRDFKTFAAFRLESPSVQDRYWEMLSYEPGGNVAAALFSVPGKFCLAGSSGAWAIWGERPLGVAIVCTTGADTSWQGGDESFATVTEALSDFVEPNFTRQPMSEKFRETFLRNFRLLNAIGVTEPSASSSVPTWR